MNDARVAVGTKVHVYVTSVASPEDFFCQLTETSAELDDLMDKIEAYYRPLLEREQAYTDLQVSRFRIQDGVGSLADDCNFVCTPGSSV